MRQDIINSLANALLADIHNQPAQPYARYVPAPSGTQFNVTVTSRNSKPGESALSDPPASGTVS